MANKCKYCICKKCNKLFCDNKPCENCNNFVERCEDKE